MRAALHRIRFVDYKPSGIVALAQHPRGQFIAAARENADLELWACDKHGFRVEAGTATGSAPPVSASSVERGQSPQRWPLLCVIPGSPRAAIRSMVWVDLASPSTSPTGPASGRRGDAALAFTRRCRCSSRQRRGNNPRLGRLRPRARGASSGVDRRPPAAPLSQQQQW
jgi:hypothetical protein